MGDPVVISDYDPEWPHTFVQFRDRAAAGLGNLPVAIQHIGATSVPGCAGKPIVDLDVVVGSEDDVAEAIARLEAIGYAYRGDLGVAGREAFAHPEGERRHHLYVVVEGNEAHRAHILLRNRLRADPLEAAAYSKLKRELTARFGEDRVGYTEAKSDFIARLLEEGETA